MKIAVASDHAGYALKERIKGHLAGHGHEVSDFGTPGTESVDYPDFGGPAALAVARGDAERGVLVCGSGQGMCMVANKVRGVRAALAWIPEIARLSRQHNDANVLCLAARFLGESDALAIVEAWLEEPFEGGRHVRRVDKILRYEEQEEEG
jgi:ribose 5-phosphate isomerase B